ncbi:hypothetical protein [Streptomyces daqingensis]|uniref:hypothetical protein n=1 Tax=Streptomyces daqingensis TaxID=1472640 RepID=UPI001669814B|nr:hypothetical protein [Streptomyces daqingensis]
MARPVRRCRPRGPLAGLSGPLFRWGFTLVAVVAFAHEHVGAALVAGGLAWAAWTVHPSPRRRTRSRRRCCTCR